MGCAASTGCMGSSASESRLKRKALCATPFYLHLSEKHIESFSRLFKVERFDEGAVIAEQGAPTDKLYVIWEGQVILTVDGDHGDRDSHGDGNLCDTASYGCSDPPPFKRAETRALLGIDRPVRKRSSQELARRLQELNAKNSDDDVELSSGDDLSSEGSVEDEGDEMDTDHAQFEAAAAAAEGVDGGGGEEDEEEEDGDDDDGVCVSDEEAGQAAEDRAALYEMMQRRSDDVGKREDNAKGGYAEAEADANDGGAAEETGSSDELDLHNVITSDEPVPPTTKPVDEGHADCAGGSMHTTLPGAVATGRRLSEAIGSCMPGDTDVDSGASTTEPASKIGGDASGGVEYLYGAKRSRTSKRSSALASKLADFTSSQWGRRIRGRLLTCRAEGSFIGNNDILTDGGVHHARVAAMCEVVTISLTRQALKYYLSRHPDIKVVVSEVLGTSVAEYLQDVPLFKGVPASKLDLVVPMLHFTPLDEDEVLFFEGEMDTMGNSMYILYSGTCRAVAYDENGNERVLNSFGRGQFFGEIGLLIDIPRTATIEAESRCLCLELTKPDFWNFLKLNESPELENNLAQLLKVRIADSFRKYNVPLFNCIPGDKYPLLGSVCRLEQVPEGATIFQEGDLGDTLYLIVHGTVGVCCRKLVHGLIQEIELARLSSGSFFGEAALLRDSRRNASVVTLTRTVMVTLDREAFDEFCVLVPDLRATIEMRLMRYEADFDAVMFYPQGKAFFIQHLEREFSTENMMFHDAVDGFVKRWKHCPFAGHASTQPQSSSSRAATMAEDMLKNEFLFHEDSVRRTLSLNTKPQKLGVIRSNTSSNEPESPVSPQSRSRGSVVSDDQMGVLSGAEDPSDVFAERTYDVSLTGMLHHARDIVEMFVRPGSTNEVNIHHSTRTRVLDVYDSSAHALVKEQAQGKQLVHVASTITCQLFDKAQQEVRKLLRTDSFPRFKQSELFQKFVATLGDMNATVGPPASGASGSAPASPRLVKVKRTNTRSKPGIGGRRNQHLQDHMFKHMNAARDRQSSLIAVRSDPGGAAAGAGAGSDVGSGMAGADDVSPSRQISDVARQFHSQATDVVQW